MDAHKKVELICAAADSKKADEIMIMDMKGRSAFCDYFVVMSAQSSVRVKAIVDGVEESMEDADAPALHKEGYAESAWVLLDFGGVVAHVFYHETRKFYDLENLWGDAPRRSYTKP
ncbi:MAG: ribosome silencing factor [Candidatus Omnitrophica bacterium]|nr:ribosome silencing factor [Candidatus Omnitrophota bacterium]